MTDVSESSTAPRARPSLGRFPALDGLRGIFVLLVVAWHTFYILLPRGGYNRDRVVSPVPGAFIGVDLFFVLSGFLITALLLREQTQGDGRIRFLAFYRRRALRLLPALVAVVVAYSLYSLFTGVEAHRTRASILPVLFYYSNWAQVASHFQGYAKGLSHTWSLAIEEQFYMVWPIVITIFLGIRRSLATATAVILAALGAVELYRLHLFYSGAPLAKLVIYTSTTTRCDGLLVGALVAQWWARGRVPRRGLTAAAWIATAFLAYAVRQQPGASNFYYKGGFTLIAVAGAVLVLAAVEADWAAGGLLRWPVLTAIGTVSYGLYLWHVPVFAAVQHFGTTWPSAGRVLVGFGLSAALTWVSWRCIERPFLRLKSRLDTGPRAEVHEGTPARPASEARLRARSAAARIRPVK